MQAMFSKGRKKSIKFKHGKSTTRRNGNGSDEIMVEGEENADEVQVANSQPLSQRKLPDLPPEAHKSVGTRIWASIKQKIGSGPNPHNSQIVSGFFTTPAQPSSSLRGTLLGPKPLNGRRPLPSYRYCDTLHADSSPGYVLPGLRLRPPAADDSYSVPRASSMYCTLNTNSSSHPENSGAVTRRHSLPSPEDLPTTAADNYMDISPMPPQRRLQELIRGLYSRVWYWGPLTSKETEKILENKEDGAFLVRDSSDDKYLYSLSFRLGGRTLHTRIEYLGNVFSLYHRVLNRQSGSYESVEELIEQTMSKSRQGNHDLLRRPGRPGHPPEYVSIKLLHPVSRYSTVPSLQFLARFAIRTNVRSDGIDTLPLPVHVKQWVKEKNYFT